MMNQAQNCASDYLKIKAREEKLLRCAFQVPLQPLSCRQADRPGFLLQGFLDLLLANSECSAVTGARMGKY